MNPSPLQSNQPLSRPFIYVSHHQEWENIAKKLMNILHMDNPLLYYSPHWDEYYSKAPSDSPTDLSSKEEIQHYNRQRILHDPHSVLFLGIITLEFLRSPWNLLEFLESQIKHPSVFVPLIMTPTPLYNGKEYEDMLNLLEDMEFSPEEEELIPHLRTRLENIYEKMTHFEVRNGYPHENKDTMEQWSTFLENPQEKFTPALCYGIFKEIINYMDCNYIYAFEYSDNTLEHFFDNLTIRLQNSTKGGDSPFLNVLQIAPQDEKHYFNQYIHTIKKYNRFHRVTPEEWVAEEGGLCSLGTSAPKVVLNLSLREIREKALNYNNTLEEIILPDGLLSIQNMAFDCCSSLQQVYFPKTLQHIGLSAFQDCVSLETVELPTGLTALEKYAFYGCVALTSVFLPSTLTSIEEFTFAECNKLEKITIPPRIQSIKNCAFANCTSLKEVRLPTSLESIESNVFSHSNLKKIKLPEGLLQIGMLAFEHTKLKSVVLPSTLQRVEEGAFFHCESLERVTITSSETQLENGVWKNCQNLKELIIPSTMDTLNFAAFVQCPSLQIFKKDMG